MKSSSSSSSFETTCTDGVVATVPGVIHPQLAPAVALASRQNRNRIVIGASLRLWSVEGVADDLGIEPDAAKSLLDVLGISLLKLPGSDKRYCNLYWLESALFAMSTPEHYIRTADGAQDPALIRLHQELAGAMYLAASKEAIRERVKKLAKEMGRGLTSPKKLPMIGKEPKWKDGDYRAI
jgi:hypothetical protein